MTGLPRKSPDGLTGGKKKSIRPDIAGHHDTPLNIALVGGGRACCEFLTMLEKGHLARLKMKILGICDKDPDSPGLRYAKTLGIGTTNILEDIFELEGLNLIIELTGLPESLSELQRKTPSHISVIDHRTAALVWSLVHSEEGKKPVEKDRSGVQEQEQKHIQIILDSLPYRIMVVGLDKTITTVNRTFLKEFHYSRDQVIGKHCYDVKSGKNRPCKNGGIGCFLEEHLEEIREKGIFSTFEEVVDDKGNTGFDVVTLAPIYDEQGNFVQILEASRDVTERVKLEKEVQKSRGFFEKVIQSSVDGIVVVDIRGNVLIFNEGMERLTGYSANEIIDRGHLSSFYNIETARENMKKMRSEAYGPPGKLNPIGMSITSHDGKEIPVTLSASIIAIDEKEIGSVGIFTDMREFLKMRKELEEANIQLVQSQKIASVGRMAAGVAHEINNPLSAILIYTELLKDALGKDLQGLKDLQEIVDQTMRCKKIVSELLEFSRKSAGKSASFGLEETINKCLSLLTSKANFQNITVTTKVEPGMPLMMGDISQIQQVFTNLFINAADAMEGKGLLNIAIRFDHERSKFIVRVSDTGPGIPKKFKDKIFDIFFTSKPVGQGTGLGLSISQNIIKLHGGNISFECPPGGGTVFIIEMPLKYAAPPGEESVFLGMDDA